MNLDICSDIFLSRIVEIICEMLCSFFVLSSFLWKEEISANLRSVGNSQFNIALSQISLIKGKAIQGNQWLFWLECHRCCLLFMMSIFCLQFHLSLCYWKKLLVTFSIISNVFHFIIQIVWRSETNNVMDSLTRSLGHIHKILSARGGIWNYINKMSTPNSSLIKKDVFVKFFKGLCQSLKDFPTPILLTGKKAVWCLSVCLPAVCLFMCDVCLLAVVDFLIHLLNVMCAKSCLCSRLL